jgi:predicted Zn-dependent protease
MQAWVLILCAVLLGGCASQPTLHPAPVPELFHDQYFAPARHPIDTSRVFAVTPQMRDYVRHQLGKTVAGKDVRRQLFDALYRRDQLQLEYDAAVTRTAAETFEARAGNCLSLAIMTAALASELNLPVTYQQIEVEEVWSRAGNLYFASNHVNLALGRPRGEQGIYTTYRMDQAQALTVDFIPVPPKARENARPLEEQTVLAMFLNNRAAELLADGQVDDAYWAARQGAAADPGFTNIYNTLGVIYQHHGHPAAAAQALRHALGRQPDNTIYLSNLATTLESLQQPEEAAALRARLARLEPYPPFHFFHLGQAAMQAGDYQRARTLFERELERVPDYHEFHFWLAVANYQLGNLAAADRHLAQAVQNSTTRGAHDLYAAKLDRLRAYEARLRIK